MFTVVGLGVALGLLIAAARAHITALTVPLGLTLALGGLAFAWSRLSLRHADCERRLSATRLFPLEDVDLDLRVTNAKRLPVPWVSVKDEVPPGLEVIGALDQSDPSAIEHTFVLPSRSAVNLSSRLRCLRRGYFTLGPLQLTAGDIFGIYARTRDVAANDVIVVYPRLYEMDELGLPARAFLGERILPSQTLEDPTRSRGVRPYVPGDSPRHVHWKVTARTGRLHVRVHERTTSHKVGIFLVVDSFVDLGEDEFELAVSTAASVARLALDHGGQAGLWVNGELVGGGRGVRLPAAGGQDQLVQILEALARVTFKPGSEFTDFFAEQRRSLTFGVSLVFVLGSVSVPVQAMLADANEAGLKPMVLQVGEAAEGRVPGVPWRRVSAAGSAPAGAEEGF